MHEILIVRIFFFVFLFSILEKQKTVAHLKKWLVEKVIRQSKKRMDCILNNTNSIQVSLIFMAPIHNNKQFKVFKI